MRNGELSDADGVCQIDIEEGVSRCGGVVFRWWAAGRVPEVGEGLEVGVSYAVFIVELDIGE